MGGNRFIAGYSLALALSWPMWIAGYAMVRGLYGILTGGAL